MGKNDFQYRHFLYLDGNEVLNTAAVLEGGEVTDELVTLARELRGNLGIKFALASVGVNLGAGGSRRFQREVKLRRTVYVQADRVLGALKHKDISPLLKRQPPGGFDENDIVKCDIDLQSSLSANYDKEENLAGSDDNRTGWPLIRSRWRWLWPRRDPAVEAAKQREEKFGSRFFEEFNVIADNSTGAAAALLLLEAQWLLDYPWYGRRASMIGQVIGVRRNNEQLIVSGDRAKAWFEPPNNANADTPASMGEMSGQSGQPKPATADASTALQRPGDNKKISGAPVVLRPIMIYR